MEVDGPNNSVVECDTTALPMGPDNPYGNAFFVTERALESELQAQRDVDFARMRYWKIVNPEAKNWVGNPTGYKLEPSSAVRPFTHPDSPSGKRGRFIQHQLWAVSYTHLPCAACCPRSTLAASPASASPAAWSARG